MLSGAWKNVVLASVVGTLPAMASEQRAAAETIDIRAFGDSAYIGGIGLFEAPPPDWVATRLRGLKGIRSNDVNFLNLEGSLTRSCNKFLPKPFTFAVSPEGLAQFGAWGFNLIGLANNHTLDCLDPAPGPEVVRALAEVKKLVPGLVAHGISSSTKSLFGSPAILDVRGVRLGMVAIKAWGNGRKATLGNLDNYDAVMAGLARSSVDVRILSLHGGIENSRRPTDDVMNMAREFVNKYDGDVVFAHHPHKSQGFEVLNKKNGRVAVIFYSLGNGLHNGLSVNGDGLAAQVKADHNGVVPTSLAVYPLASPALRPRLLSRSELKDTASILRASSAAIALRPLPKELTRIPFTLQTLSKPAAGLKLVLGSDEPVARTPEPPAKGQLVRDDDTADVRSLARPPAQWIPPAGQLAH